MGELAKPIKIKIEGEKRGRKKAPMAVNKSQDSPDMFSVLQHQLNKIKRICKFASRFCKFSCALQGVLRIILNAKNSKKNLQKYQGKKLLQKISEK